MLTLITLGFMAANMVLRAVTHQPEYYVGAQVWCAATFIISVMEAKK